MEKTKFIHPSARKHWHFLYKHRRRSTNASTKQIIAGQIFTIIVSVGAGVWLDSVKYSIIGFAGALLLLPGIVDLSASLAGSLGAKINHLLEESDKHPLRVMVVSTVYALVVSMFAGALVGLIGGIIGSIFFEADLYMMIKLMLITMALVGIVIYPVVAILVVIVRHFKWNPDNLVGPIQSSLVDVLAIIMLAITIGILV